MNPNLVETPVDPSEYDGEPYPRPGGLVRLSGDGPPWLVVHHRLDRVPVPRWPVRLWRVDDVVAAPPEHQVVRSERDRPYTRALGYRVVEELDAWMLFGYLGWKSAWIIDRLADFDAEDAVALACAFNPDAYSVIRRARRRQEDWVGRQGMRSKPTGRADHLVSEALDLAARRTDPGLLAWDSYNEVESLADPTWRSALVVVLHAVTAYGSPELLGPDSPSLLAAPWYAHFGEPPAQPGPRP